jgi:hypothetical protein
MSIKTPEPATLIAEMGAPLDPAAYDWRLAAADPLSDDEIFQLTYAAQVEWGTEGTFASLNISRDPVVKRFLHIWLEQEVVHANLLARVLESSGVRVEPLHRTVRQRFGAQRGKWVNQLARRAIGDDFFGVHMAWGAINELTTLRFYGVVRNTTQHRLLRTVLRDVMAQEALHYSFYRTVAIRQLDGNPRGQRIVRWALDHLWSPVGTGLRSRDDVEQVMRALFSGRNDQVTQIDAALDRIPGLEGLGLIERTMEVAGRRAA